MRSADPEDSAVSAWTCEYGRGFEWWAAGRDTRRGLLWASRTFFGRKEKGEFTKQLVCSCPAGPGHAMYTHQGG